MIQCPGLSQACGASFTPPLRRPGLENFEFTHRQGETLSQNQTESWFQDCQHQQFSLQTLREAGKGLVQRVLLKDLSDIHVTHVS